MPAMSSRKLVKLLRKKEHKDEVLLLSLPTCRTMPRLR